MLKKWTTLVLVLMIVGSLCITSCVKRVAISEPVHVSMEGK